MQRDCNWEVLDLKKPTAKLLAGKGPRTRFSQEVASAIAQLRDYGEYFRDPRNAAAIASLLGHSLRYPRLAVLIGRLPRGAELEALETVQAREFVKIVTYDEILERQRSLLGR
jgi:hypothetical protein